MNLTQPKQKTDFRTTALMQAVNVISSYVDNLEKAFASGRRKEPICLLPYPKNERLEAIELFKSCKDNITDHKRLLTLMDQQQVEINLVYKCLLVPFF